MKRLYEWLFTQQEREPIGFIYVFFLVVGSMAITLYIVHLMFLARGY